MLGQFVPLLIVPVTYSLTYTCLFILYDAHCIFNLFHFNYLKTKLILFAITGINIGHKWTQMDTNGYKWTQMDNKMDTNG
ncbi:MAG: hypothetical protein ABIN36_06825 [Ferruginibacter sp.]